MALQRYVNLGKVSVYVQNPSGQTVIVHPFRESLDDRSRRADAIYVVEGEFWARYMSQAGPLHRFPLPKSFGRETFPALPVHHLDGRPDDGAILTDGAARPQVAAVATPGRFRAAGDVITPQGKIRRRNPITGEDEEVDDIPANRNVLPPVNLPGQTPPQLRVSIVDFMESRGIDTLEKFDALTDKDLLSIPGMHAHAIPRLRENVREFMRKQAEAADPAREARMSVGATDGTTSVVAPSGDTVSKPTKIEPLKKAKKRKAEPTLGERIKKEPPVNLKRKK